MTDTVGGGLNRVGLGFWSEAKNRAACAEGDNNVFSPIGRGVGRNNEEGHAEVDGRG